MKTQSARNIKNFAQQHPARERDSIALKKMLLIVVVGIILLLPFFTYTWQQIEIIRYGYEIEELKRQRKELLEAHEALKIRKAALESLDRVEKIARGKLGLTDPSRDQVVLVSVSESKKQESSVARRLP
jgi:cell division protein FtsL